MFQKREGQILKKKKVREMANCDCDLHLTPDEKDVQVDGGEDKEGNGHEEEKDVPRCMLMMRSSMKVNQPNQHCC